MSLGRRNLETEGGPRVGAERLRRLCDVSGAIFCLMLAAGLSLTAHAGTPPASVASPSGADAKLLRAKEKVPGSYIVILKDDVALPKTMARFAKYLGRNEGSARKDAVEELLAWFPEGSSDRRMAADILTRFRTIEAFLRAGREERARIQQAVEPEVEEAAQRLASDYHATLVHRYTAAAGPKGFSARMTSEAAIALSQDPRVDHVEEDALVHLNGVTSSPQSSGVRTGVDWSLDRIDQRGWDTSKGKDGGDGKFRSDATGRGVVIYVVDSGVSASPPVEGPATILAGFSAYGDSNNALVDQCGHGTVVAKIAAGRAGVAPDASVVPVKVLDYALGKCSGPLEKLAAGLVWILRDVSDARFDTPVVINESVGSEQPSNGNAFAAMLHFLIGAQARRSIIIAAGNDGDGAEFDQGDACNYFPSRLGGWGTGTGSRVVTVGSSTETDSRAHDSNWGSCVDLFAPGADVFDGVSGTSFAAPLVTGAVANLLQMAPGLTSQDAKDILRRRATTDKLDVLDRWSPNRLLYARLTKVETMRDGGFEVGGWVESRPGLRASGASAPHSGSWYARLGGLGTAHTDTLTYPFPGGIDLDLVGDAVGFRLRFFIRTTTFEPGSSIADTLTVKLVFRDAGTVTWGTYSNRSKNAGYVLQTGFVRKPGDRLDQIIFEATENGSNATTFQIDDVSVEVWQ